MAAENDHQEVTCAPEVDSKLNPSVNGMQPLLKEDACCFSGEIKKTESICIILRNSENKVLYFKEREKMAVFEEMPDNDAEANASGTHLMLQHYSCNNQKHSVAISVKGRNNSYLLSCKSDKELQFKDGDFPDKIEHKDEDILFRENGVIGFEKVKFESYLYPEHYLAFEENQNTEKLVLKDALYSEEKCIMFTRKIC